MSENSSISVQPWAATKARTGPAAPSSPARYVPVRRSIHGRAPPHSVPGAVELPSACLGQAVDAVAALGTGVAWSVLANAVEHVDRVPLLFQAGEEAADGMLSPARGLDHVRDGSALGAAQGGRARLPAWCPALECVSGELAQVLLLARPGERPLRRPAAHVRRGRPSRRAARRPRPATWAGVAGWRALRAPGVVGDGVGQGACLARGSRFYAAVGGKVLVEFTNGLAADISDAKPGDLPSSFQLALVSDASARATKRH